MELLKTEDFENIYEVESFQKEFKKITNNDRRYVKWLISKLSILDNYGMRALQQPEFESLSGTDPKLYSMRYPHSKVNPRVIYVYVNGKDIILLTAFKEGSKKSNSEYGSAIKIACDRLKYLKIYF